MHDVHLSISSCRYTVIQPPNVPSANRAAVLAGLHHDYVGSVERSERKVSPDNIRPLAHALEVTAADLLTLARAAPEQGRD